MKYQMIQQKQLKVAYYLKMLLLLPVLTIVSINIILYCDRTDVSEDKDVKIKTNNLLEFKDCHYNCCLFFFK